jgi:hypothetical protein
MKYDLKTFISVFIATFLVTVSAVFPQMATAKWTRTHASSCMTLGGAPIDTSYAIYNNSTSAEMYALCAVDDSDYLLKQNLTTLNIHGWDGNSTLKAGAMACRSLWHTTGGSCGTLVETAVGQQHFTLQPSRSQWNSSTTADFGYIWVRLPRKETTGGISSLRGFYTFGN